LGSGEGLAGYRPFGLLGGVYFNVKNLTDAPWRIYEGTRDRVIQQEYYDFTYEAGMKFKF